ncbi:lysophospholipid acyltransferase family protein [Aureimonas jatrophae]|uniref:Acyltransferase n=1 Tax=Aureimonas jatrophae TaxID=1166073 RepID=A0A1H0D2Y8_9HYPH|nr:lysophospholipid acyltransferase family protein [Aureimonas jatrophae]MBB3951682.1 1-acyl-sn-glycerol-3-phosphate acyltransferase [Aureimonas jatrophae]SDN64497.1 Acyltransferase [Aureimonas jatrophae]
MIDHLLVALARFLVGGRPDWIGAQPSPRQRIYFANHGSHLDTVLLWAALPKSLRATTHPVAAADYWGRGRLRRAVAIGLLNSVLVDRAGTASGRDPLEPLEAELARGHSLVIFPEGTRGPEKLPGPFKSGLFRLATRFPEAELVPIYLENLSRAFPRGAYLPVPISCHVRIGAPMHLAPGEEKDAFLARARGAVVALAEVR